MQISNENSRLTFICFMAGKKGNKEQIIAKGNELIKYRIENKDRIDVNWNVLFEAQYHQMNDQIGTKDLGFLPKNISTDEFW